MDGMTQTIRKEMQCMSAGLQDGLEKLKIGNGELRRATCWGRRVEVTEKVTETVTREELNGVTETYTRGTRHQVTEMTRIGERLHGVEEEEDAHTHTHTEVARDNGGELAERPHGVRGLD